MELITFVWKLSYTLHMISNAGFLGSSIITLFLLGKTTDTNILGLYKKISSIFITVSGLTGFGLLSILSMGGMDDLTSNVVGQSILMMIGSFFIVLFIFILFLIYRGGEIKVERVLIFIMLLFYVLTYMVRVVLVH